MFKSAFMLAAALAATAVATWVARRELPHLEGKVSSQILRDKGY